MASSFCASGAGAGIEAAAAAGAAGATDAGAAFPKLKVAKGDLAGVAAGAGAVASDAAG